MNVTPTTVMRKFIALAIVVGAAILYNKLSCNHWPIESKVDSPSKTLRIPSATMTIAILTKLLEIRMVANKYLGLSLSVNARFEEANSDSSKSFISLIFREK